MFQEESRLDRQRVGTSTAASRTFTVPEVARRCPSVAATQELLLSHRLSSSVPVAFILRAILCSLARKRERPGSSGDRAGRFGAVAAHVEHEAPRRNIEIPEAGS